MMIFFFGFKDTYLDPSHCIERTNRQCSEGWGMCRKGRLDNPHLGNFPDKTISHPFGAFVTRFLTPQVSANTAEKKRAKMIAVAKITAEVAMR